jgi:hypothetical protein
MLESEPLHLNPLLSQPLGMIDVVDMQDPDPKKRRDWVWLAQTEDRFSVAVLINNGEGYLAWLNHFHTVGVDNPVIRVSMLDGMTPQQAHHKAKIHVKRWMSQITGHSELIGSGTPINLRVGANRHRPPVLSVQHRETDERVRAITQFALPFDNIHILRNAPCFSRTFVYRCNWDPTEERVR